MNKRKTQGKKNIGEGNEKQNKESRKRNRK
jgi:hypothetical protein